jgi:hypothetical protein
MDQTDLNALLDDILNDKPVVITPEPEKPSNDAATPIEQPEVSTQCVAEPVAEPETPSDGSSVFQNIFTDTASESVTIPMPVFNVDEMADVTDIRRFGQLVTLNTQRWHARVKDRKASTDVAVANNASADAFDTHKNLLAGAAKLKAVHKALDEARDKHYEMTLPWSTTGLSDSGRRSGARILPNTLFFEYTEAMAKAKVRMMEALKDFESDYPSLIEQARVKLGKRFDPREYPPVERISDYFNINFDFQPIPAGSDFKGLPQQQLDALARHLQNNMRVMVENAMQDVWAQLYEAISHMVDRLSDPERTFHHTLIDNVREKARLAKHLNVLNDQRVEKVRAYAERYLCQHDAETLRKKLTIRAEVAAHAKTALDMMNKEAKV